MVQNDAYAKQKKLSLIMGPYLDVSTDTKCLQMVAMVRCEMYRTSRDGRVQGGEGGVALGGDNHNIPGVCQGRLWTDNR